VPRPFVDNIRTAAALIPPGHRLRWMLQIPLSLLAAAVESATAASIFALIATLHDSRGASSLPVLSYLHEHSPVGWKDENGLRTVLMVTTASLMLLRILVSVSAAAFEQRVIARDHAALSQRLFQAYLAAPYDFHLQRNVSDYLYRITTAVHHVFSVVLGGAAALFHGLTLALALLAVLLLVSVEATLGSVAFLGVWVWAVSRVLRDRIQRIGAASDHYNRMRHRVMLQALSAMREIKVLGREPHFGSSFEAWQGHMVEVAWRNGLLNLVPRLTLESLLLAVVLLAVSAMLTASKDPSTLLPMLGLYAYVAMRLIPTVHGAVFHYNGIVASTAPLGHLLADWQKLQPYLHEPDRQPPPLPFERALELDRVGFRYAGSDADALRDVDLDIARGERIGIVGPTGAGKSTLVHILLGLLEPSSGAVRADGADLFTNGRAWRRRVGFVPQTITLLDDSIRVNVALGIEPSDIDDARVWQCLATARLDELVRGLPAGLDTEIGDRGIRLSGGQQQRLAIARAIYHDPDVLLFDEATASLDVRTEREVSRAIDELGRTRTTVLVAHRVSTVAECDRIVVMDQGRVVAIGTYGRLLVECALFRELARGSEPARPVLRAVSG